MLGFQCVDILQAQLLMPTSLGEHSVNTCQNVSKMLKDDSSGSAFSWIEVTVTRELPAPEFPHARKLKDSEGSMTNFKSEPKLGGTISHANFM